MRVLCNNDDLHHRHSLIFEIKRYVRNIIASLFIDAKKTRSPKKRKAVTKASKLRDSSPSPSPSPVKATQRRGQKGSDYESCFITAEPFAVRFKQFKCTLVRKVATLCVFWLN